LAFETGLATFVTHKKCTFPYTFKLSKKDASPTYAEYTANKTILKRQRIKQEKQTGRIACRSV
jgi:hypothetical protein